MSLFLIIIFDKIFHCLTSKFECSQIIIKLHVLIIHSLSNTKMSFYFLPVSERCVTKLLISYFPNMILARV